MGTHKPWKNKNKDGLTDAQNTRKTYRHTDREADRQTEGQADRQTDKRTRKSNFDPLPIRNLCAPLGSP